jgi:hypothetical protein
MIAHLLIYFALLLNPWQQPMGYGGGAGVGNHIALQNGCSARNTGSVSSFGLAIFGATNCNNTSYVPATNDVINIFWGLGTAQASITSCTDTNSNTWTTYVYAGSSNRTFVAQSKLTTGGNTTVTCSWPSASTVIALEGDFSGAQNVFDGGGFSFATQGSSTTQTLPSLTTVNANDVILGCFYNAGGGTATAYTAVSPYTAYAGLSGSTINGYCEYNLVTVTGTYAPQLTLTVATVGYAATMGIESQ